MHIDRFMFPKYSIYYRPLAEFIPSRGTCFRSYSIGGIEYDQVWKYVPCEGKNSAGGQ